MNKAIEKDVFFTLHSITCKQSINVIRLFVVESDNSKSARYIDFYFYSIDDLFNYLRGLARSSGSYSISNLQDGSFPAKISYAEKFMEPDEFIAFYLPPNRIWPSPDAKAHFVLDIPC